MATVSTPASDGDETLRLDRWLWAARLFKTRAQAVEAISRGRVELNGARAKPAKPVRPGDHVTVRRPPHRSELVVCGLSARRVGASLVPTLYSETAASVAAREALDRALALDAVIEDRRHGKLDKRARRQREQLKRSHPAERGQA